MRAGPVGPPRSEHGLATVVLAWSGAAVFAGSLVYFLYAYLVRFGHPAPPGPVARPIAINLLLFTLFAAHHSVLARTGIKRRLHLRVRPAIERSLYTWTASLLFLAACVWWQPIPGVIYSIPQPWALAGYAVQAAGIALTLVGAAGVDALDLAGVRPALLARSGRSPRHVALKTAGVYGFVRHPLYFAWMLFVFGAPAMTATRASFAAISTAYLALAIPWEERSLVEVFGNEYQTYRRNVRWRMIPFLY
jgi:methanethiol S-methyltransferase